MLFHLLYLRLLAILLIVNSHLGPMYPSASMAFGGHLGNSLFFFLSGLGLTLSYQRHPIPPGQWAMKRIIKVILPVLLFVAVVYIGDLDGFIHHVFKYLIWHDRYQLTEFLPVLWALYVVFLPLHSLSPKSLKVVTGLVAGLACGLLIHRAQHLSAVPSYLPSSDIFFVLNALLCFLFGMQFARPAPATRRRSWLLPLLIVAIIASQLLHHLMLQVGGMAIAVNFYANLISVVAFYLLFEAAPLEWSRPGMPLISALASSSLAVYIVHFSIISIVATAGPPFPYNAIGTYIYSFVFAYGLTVFADRVSGWTVSQASRRLRS